MEHGDAIRDAEHRCHVVGDDHGGDLIPLAGIEDHLVDVPRGQGIEAGCRFVVHEDLGLQHQRSCEAHALAHAARQLSRVLLLSALEAECLELLGDDIPDLGVGLLGVFLERKRTVLLHRQRIEQCRELEHQAELPAELRQLLRAERQHVGPIDPDVAFVRAQEAHEVLDEDTLTGAGGTQDHVDLAALDVQIEVVQHQVRSERLREPAHTDLPARILLLRRRLADDLVRGRGVRHQVFPVPKIVNKMSVRK